MTNQNRMRLFYKIDYIRSVYFMQRKKMYLIFFKSTFIYVKSVLLLQADCEPRTEIVGSRFVLQGYRILNSRDEAKVVEELRNICHHSNYNVTVFHPYFIYFDQVHT